MTLGIGMPTEAANYLPEGVHISVQAENGIVCCGLKPEIGFEDEHITDAGGNNATILPGGAFFDSSMSFTMIRGGHINKTVLGSLQVDEKGNLANYLIPGNGWGNGFGCRCTRSYCCYGALCKGWFTKNTS